MEIANLVMRGGRIQEIVMCYDISAVETKKIVTCYLNNASVAESDSNKTYRTINRKVNALDVEYRHIARIDVRTNTQPCTNIRLLTLFNIRHWTKTKTFYRRCCTIYVPNISGFYSNWQLFIYAVNKYCNSVNTRYCAFLLNC